MLFRGRYYPLGWVAIGGGVMTMACWEGPSGWLYCGLGCLVAFGAPILLSSKAGPERVNYWTVPFLLIVSVLTLAALAIRLNVFPVEDPTIQTGLILLLVVLGLWQSIVFGKDRRRRHAQSNDHSDSR